jgi:ERCC4-type nuclease
LAGGKGGSGGLILADEHKNEADVISILKGIVPAGIPIVISRIPSDYIFYGEGNSGQPLTIGIERKKTSDILQCVVSTNRVVEQVRKAKEWGVNVQYLFIESSIRPSPKNGCVQQLRGNAWRDVPPRTAWGRLANYLETLDTKLGVKVRHTDSARGTAQTIYDLWRWWQRAPEQHGVWADNYKPLDLGRRASLFRRMLGEVAGVGRQRAIDAEIHFEGYRLLSVLAMSEEQWERVPGIGSTTAFAIREQLSQILLDGQKL